MNNLKVNSFLCAIMIGATAFAGDINFIQRSDLPLEALRSYSESGKQANISMPVFPNGYGITQALQDDSGEGQCMALLGKQLAPWKTEINPGLYWNYTISAPFACLAPVQQVTLSNSAARKLIRDLQVAKLTQNLQFAVLCYDQLQDICDPGDDILVNYRHHIICEINDTKLGKLTTLEDITEDNTAGDIQIQNQGARALASDLPIYTDGRRDDSDSGKNCPARIPGKLKGLTRQAAKISCNSGSDFSDLSLACVIEGMIKTDH